MNIYEKIRSIYYKPVSRQLLRSLPGKVSQRRFEHILGVSKTAQTIALRLRGSVTKTRLAALGHDLARQWDGQEYIKFLEERGFSLSLDQKDRPILLHGPVAAQIMKEQYNVHDDEVLQAIQHHTLGKAGMSLTGKILYVADYIEPGRKYIDSSFYIDVIESESIHIMLLKVINHARGREKVIGPQAMEMETEALESFQKKPEEQVAYETQTV